MEWYEKLRDEQIEWLKNNRVIGELLTDDEWKLLASVPIEDLQSYGNRGKWDAVVYIERDDVNVYRLRPDWQRPKKGGEWEICEVFQNGRQWEFILGRRPHYLYAAPSMVGFGGVEYKEWPGRWVLNVAALVFEVFEQTLRIRGDVENEVNCRPATPVRVRFWRGEA